MHILGCLCKLQTLTLLGVRCDLRCVCVHMWVLLLQLGLAYAGIAVATYLTHSYHLFWQLIEGIFGGT